MIDSAYDLLPPTDGGATKYYKNCPIKLRNTYSPAAGGTTVTLTGTGFQYITGITFSGDVASTYTVNSSTSITVHSPANSTGVTYIRVTNVAGTSPFNSGNKFTYTP